MGAGHEINKLILTLNFCSGKWLDLPCLALPHHHLSLLLNEKKAKSSNQLSAWSPSLSGIDLTFKSPAGERWASSKLEIHSENEYWMARAGQTRLSSYHVVRKTQYSSACSQYEKCIQLQRLHQVCVLHFTTQTSVSQIFLQSFFNLTFDNHSLIWLASI